MQRKKTNFGGTEDDFFTIVNIVVASCLANIDPFEAQKPQYTPAFVKAIQDSATAAYALPNNRARQNFSSRFMTALEYATADCCTNMNMLMYFISQSFAPEAVETKKIEGGWGYFHDAAHRVWKAVTPMNMAMTAFIDDNSAALVEGGMPEDFPSTCDDANAAFTAAFADYTANRIAAKGQTNDRTDALNAVYARLTALMTDGKFIFRNNPLVREQFTYSAVLRSIRKGGKTGFRIEVKNKATNEPIANAHLSFTDSSVTKNSNEKGIIVLEMAEGKYNYIIAATGYSTQVGSITAKKGVMRHPKIEMTAGAPGDIVKQASRKAAEQKVGA